MSYSITFKGGHQISVSNERGEKVKDLWFEGKGNTPIDIDGNGYLISDIKRIERATGAGFVDPWAGEDRQIAANNGPTCKGSRSIQREINNIAKHEGKGWAKLVTSKTWREKTRQALLEQDPDSWCDYLTGACVCNQSA